MYSKCETCSLFHGFLGADSKLHDEVHTKSADSCNGEGQ